MSLNFDLYDFETFYKILSEMMYSLEGQGPLRYPINK